MYRLFVTEEDGEKTLLATAPGSPFWTEMFHVAERMYDKENISYDWVVDTPKE